MGALVRQNAFPVNERGAVDPLKKCYASLSGRPWAASVRRVRTRREKVAELGDECTDMDILFNCVEHVLSPRAAP